MYSIGDGVYFQRKNDGMILEKMYIATKISREGELKEITSPDGQVIPMSHIDLSEWTYFKDGDKKPKFVRYEDRIM